MEEAAMGLAVEVLLVRGDALVAELNDQFEK